ncbi:MAG: tetratricopeptide repeat protein [Rikenellaceae bacterium]
MALLAICVSSAFAVPPQALKRGIELYNDGRWIDSRLSLLEAKDEVKPYNYDDIEEIDLYLVMCAIELDDPEAEEFLLNFEERYPSSTHLNRVRFAKAMLYCSNEQYDKAREEFKRVNYTSLNSLEREEYNIRMGYIEFLNRDYNEAKGYLMAIDEKSDVYHHALYYNSYVDYVQGDNSSARDGFTTLLSSSAYADVAPFYLIQIDFNDGKYSDVLSDGESLYSKATEVRQRELVRSMAEAAFRLEEFDKAIDYIEMYRDLDGVMKREESYILGFSLYRTVRYGEALTYLRAACGADDALTQNASYHLADCYLRAGDKSSASKSFAMAANESFSAEIAEDALFNYAKLQYELGNDRFNETINSLTRYINRYPSSGSRYNQIKELLIAVYYNSRNYDAAYQSIKELKNPDADIRLALQRISLYRGLQSYNSGDYDMAKSQINESLAVNISPKYSSIARFYLGEIDFIDKDYESALKNYNSYVVSAPKDDANYSMALYNIAYSKLMLENESEALGYYQRFIESEGDDSYYRADALNRVGDIFYGKRQFDAARENYKRATWSMFEPRQYALYQTAIIEGISGEYDAKVKRLRGIVAADEGDYVESALYELGRSYIAASDYKSGVKSHEKFILLYPSSDRYAQALSDLGLAYLNLGDSKTSLNYYDKAIKAAPQSAVAKDALQGVREIYINDGNANGYFKYASSIGHSGDLDNMMRDSLTFASAQRLYINSEGRSQAAVNSLTDYINSYPQGYYTLDALFYLSDSYEKLNKSSDAIATLIQLTKRGSNQYSERVYDRLAALTFSEKLYSQSANAYLELYKMSSKTDVKRRAITGYVEATIIDNNEKSVVKMADYVSSQNGVDAQLIVKAKHAKAVILFDNNKKDSALAIFRELCSDPHSVQGAESMYRVIESEFSKGNIDTAEQMVFDFAQSDTPHSYFLARAFIILGDIYVSRGDNFQARATYQSIIDGYGGEDDDNVVKDARSKINKLP